MEILSINPEILFNIIIIIIVFNQLLEYLLDYLNTSYRAMPIPVELDDIYNTEQYKKQQDYESDTTQLSFYSSFVSFMTILLLLFFDGFALLDNFIRLYITNEILVSLLFLASLMMFSSMLSLPFSLYRTFVIEEKYGFNKTTFKLFVLDLIKGALLSLIIGGLLLFVIIVLYQQFGSYFWIFTWGVVTLFMLFINMFYSQLIVPLFNKQIPLKEGSLRTAIEEFAKTSGFKLNNIFIINGSKRSSKANAYFSGLGPKKRIVLYDTLINDLKEEEIVAVLAHEIGHYQHKHTLKAMLTSILQTGVILFLFSILIDNPVLNQALGSEHQSFHFGLIVFGFLFEPISLLLGILTSYFSRKNEYQADAFVKQHEMESYLVSGLKQLARKNLSNLTPHPLYVFVHYSHPPIYQRIKALSIG